MAAGEEPGDAAPEGHLGTHPTEDRMVRDLHDAVTVE